MLRIVSTLLAFRSACFAASTKLLHSGTIIAFDQAAEQLRIVRDGSLLIENDRVASIFDTSSPKDLPRGTEMIDCTDKIITPGFIDTHRHGWQTVFKTSGPNAPMAEYVARYSPPAVRPLFTPEDIYISQLAGIYEAIAAGVTTILDHAHHTWTPEHAKAGLDASVDSGARVFFAYTFQNSSAEFGVLEQITQWRDLASSMSSNLTSLAISYDDWATNPSGTYTRAIIDLVK
jgi:cytosine/adenosine deaminase-related metal-dependent hydrolase